MSLKPDKASKNGSRKNCKARTKAGAHCRAPAVEEGLIRPANRINRVLGTGPQAFALEARDSIGSAGPFAHRGPGEAATSMGGWAVSSGFESTFGAWGDAHNLYLGLKFVISGEAHFGWARLSYHTGSMYLTGYAYETIANKPIAAGAESGDDALVNSSAEVDALIPISASLAHLALGDRGMTAWRRDTSQNS